jgi:hypothetical protein
MAAAGSKASFDTASDLLPTFQRNPIQSNLSTTALPHRQVVYRFRSPRWAARLYQALSRALGRVQCTGQTKSLSNVTYRSFVDRYKWRSIQNERSDNQKHVIHFYRLLLKPVTQTLKANTSNAGMPYPYPRTCHASLFNMEHVN